MRPKGASHHGPAVSCKAGGTGVCRGAGAAAHAVQTLRPSIARARAWLSTSGMLCAVIDVTRAELMRRTQCTYSVVFRTQTRVYLKRRLALPAAQGHDKWSAGALCQQRAHSKDAHAAKCVSCRARSSPSASVQTERGALSAGPCVSGSVTERVRREQWNLAALGVGDREA